MYDQFYGFEGRPFQLTPDPNFYFESVTHRKALSYLGYGLAQGEGFIVITGDIGAGKTTLVSHLMATIDTARLTAATIVTSQLNGNDLIKMAASSFGLNVDGFDKVSTLNAIEQFLHSEAREGRRCLLVVDEAQNLSIDALEELRMLSNFQLGSNALLQIFLLGQPEFRDLVHNSAALEQLRQRIIATHHLEPMNEDEIAPYIEHRLARAGWSGNPSFSEDAYTAMFDQTHGVPRQLNTLMQRILLMGAVEQLHNIDADMIAAVIADMAGQPFEYEAPLSAKAGPDDIPQSMYEKQEAEAELAAQEAEQEAAIVEAAAIAANNIEQEDAQADDMQPEAVIEATEIEDNQHDDDVLVNEAMEIAVQETEAPEIEEQEIEEQEIEAQETEAQEIEAQETEIQVIDENSGNDAPISPYYGGKTEFVKIAYDDYQKLIDRVDMLEAKLSEHDITLRQTLSMMIQWMEDNDDMRYNSKAA